MLVVLFFMWVLAPTKAAYDIKGAIVYLMEWKYEDIAKECPFLSKHNYGAVMISPPTENLVDSPDRPWHERYEPLSYKMETRSGDEEALRQMITICTKKKVRILVDIVLNNMVTSKSEKVTGTGGSEATPKDYAYPDFSKLHFKENKEGKVYQDATEAGNGEAPNLSGLKQSDPYVREKQVELMNKLIDMGVAGFMVDKAKFMWPKDLAIHQTRVKDILYTLKRSRPVMIYNVEDSGTNEAVHWYDYNLLGQVTDYKYGKEIGQYFQIKANFYDFINRETLFPDWIPSSDALVFLTNVNSYCSGRTDLIKYHENPELYKLATAFMLAYPHGQPLILSSYKIVPPSTNAGPPIGHMGDVLSPGLACEGGWNCEHRIPEVYRMVYFHQEVKDEEITSRFGANARFAFTRGNSGFIAFNLENTPWKGNFQTSMPEGDYCEIATGGLAQDRSDTCEEEATKVTVFEGGYFDMEVPPNTFRAIHTWNKIGYESEKDDPELGSSLLKIVVNLLDETGLFKIPKAVPTAAQHGKMQTSFSVEVDDDDPQQT